MNVQSHNGHWSRLLIELNRSLHHPQLFSILTKPLPKPQRQQLIDEIWTPFREVVAQQIIVAIDSGRSVIHLSIHSFTPSLDGNVRNADVAFLFDPARKIEQNIAVDWVNGLRADSRWRVRRNYPYRGAGDGHTTALRRRFSKSKYVGIEVEINQAMLADKRRAHCIADRLFAAISRQIPDLKSLG